MMDMEMNAGLGDDDGSETSEAESEGSSASSTFCDLEKDYSKVLRNMKNNELLAPYLNEYTRLFELLYKAHKTEKELLEKCDKYQAEIEKKDRKIFELKDSVSYNHTEIERLKHEHLDAIKRADAAHTREQNAQETIENLRLNVNQINQELEQKNRQLAAGEDMNVNKQKENLLKEKEMLVSEMDTLRQRMKHMSLYTEELEKRNTEIDAKLHEIQEDLDSQMSDFSKERRAKQRAEEEVHQLQEELATKTNDLATANVSIQAAANNVLKLETLLKDKRAYNEKLQKELNKQAGKVANLQMELSDMTENVETLEKEATEKDHHIKDLKKVWARTRDETNKTVIEKEAMGKRLLRVEQERASLNAQLKEAVSNVQNMEHEVFHLRKLVVEKQNEVDTLVRQRNILARSKETSDEVIKRYNHEMIVCEYSKRKMEQELDNAVGDTMEVQAQLGVAEKERDKFSTTAKILAQRVEDYISEAKLKQVEISNYKKRLAEAEARYRQQQNLFEVVRAERNTCSKSLTETLDEIEELKNKLKVVNHQIEQLKEGIAMKEADLIKEEFLRGRVEKERESVKVELQACRKEVTDLRREIEKMKQEEKSLRHVLQRAESDIGRHKKDIDNVMNERDILGTQLVRRNDELSLQYSRIKVLHGTLQRGEVQYNQRLEDIRLLKLEVKKLRTEKALLTKNIENMTDLRSEVFYLNRDLTKERLKVVALEEEVQTPLNIHRWRKLEGSDPGTFELLKKVQILQKRILKLSSDMILKEKKVKDVEKLYMNLRQIVMKHPGLEVSESLNTVRKTLREKGQKMKCLLAEVSMYKYQVSEYKIDMDKMNGEMCELKKKYYAQKRKLQKSKDPETKSVSEPSLPVVTVCSKKFRGGGFNMTASSTTTCCLIADSVCH